MPFPDQKPRAFTRENILAIQAEPKQVGVYGIFRQNAWIYVGSGIIRDELLRDHAGENPLIARQQPTHWVD